MSLTRPNKKQLHSNPETFESPAGIYVHIPFCNTKCPYCAFVSYQGMRTDMKKKYMQALGQQAHEMADHPWAGARKFHSLFIGGGTPSTVDIADMADFITSCLEEYDFSCKAGREPEVTLEANPNTINTEMLQCLKQAGVNRLSIGIQSFSEDMLNNIGRKHSAREGVQAFKLARGAGFANINLDLMYGLPGQDTVDWVRSLQQAVALLPEHLSVYELTIEPGTPFAALASQGKLGLPQEDETLEMFEQTQEFLSANGYKQYEISNYARNGCACIHNINYWENGNYIGLGSSAVSCFSGVRIKNAETPEDYIKMITQNRKPYKEAEFLPLEARLRETVIMGLRMIDGVSIPRLEKQYGMNPREYYGEILNRLVSQDLLQEEDNRLRLTKKGMLLANRVMAQLV